MKKILLFLLISFSMNSQAQDFWTEVSPFGSSVQYSSSQISIVDENVVFVTGTDYSNGPLPSQKISRSIDGGLNWTENTIDLGGLPSFTTSFYAISPTIVYLTAASSITGLGAGIWKTEDAGATWTQQISAQYDVSIFPNFIHFFDESKGIVVGDPIDGVFKIYTTINAGTTWMSVPNSAVPNALIDEYGYTLNFSSIDNSIWFGTSYGRIFKSGDMGMSWTVSQSPLTDFESSAHSGKFAFKNADEGLLATSENVQYRSVDGGSNWIMEIPSPNCPGSNDVVFVPQTVNTYFSWGNDCEGTRKSLYTTNGGQSWIDLTAEDDSPVQPLQAKFKNGTTGFCIGYNDDTQQIKFFKLTDPLFRFLKNDQFSANRFSATPNPTNGFIKITGSEVKHLTVFDITGKEIFSQDYSLLKEINLDLSAFQNGIYLAKVFDVNNNSSVLKIIKK